MNVCKNKYMRLRNRFRCLLCHKIMKTNRISMLLDDYYRTLVNNKIYLFTLKSVKMYFMTDMSNNHSILFLLLNYPMFVCRIII